MRFLYRKLFFLLVITALLFGVAAVPSAHALTSMGPLPLSLPAGWIGGDVSGVWGTNTRNLYTVGTVYGLEGNTMPVIYRNNGTSWTPFIPSLPAEWVEGVLADIWGLSTENIYAVGHGYNADYIGLPLVYHNDGSGWARSRPSLPNELLEGYLLDIFGFSTDNLYAVGYGYDAEYNMQPLLYHNDGSGWGGTALALPAGWIGGSLSGLWGSSTGELYLVGSAYDADRNTMPLLYYNNGGGWAASILLLPAGFLTGAVSGVWGTEAGGVYIAGASYDALGNPWPLLYQGNGAGWTTINLPSPAGGTAGYLSDVWGSSASDLYAVGNMIDARGTYRPLFYHNAGSGWTQIPLALSAASTEVLLNSVWGLSPNNVYFAGAGSPGTEGRAMPVIYKQMIFADVQPAYWAANFIEQIYTAGVTGGCLTTPRMYCPEGTVTRAQMAVFLLRAIHGSSYLPPAVGESTGFADVPVDYWAAAWIKQLAAEGITSGCSSGSYCPEQPVTRAEMAVFLLRSKYGTSYMAPNVGDGTGFSDVPADHWAAAWIKQLVIEGITAGCQIGMYCPNAPVTRAQMAVFLVRTFGLP